MQHSHHESEARAVFGFWIYIMSDCILFACLFATFIVLAPNTFGGPGPKELFSLPLVFKETMLLLISSFTYGIAMLAMHKQQMLRVVFWLLVTCVLGILFIAFELHEFHSLITEGNSFTRSGFLSSFFALVGTHGLHVTCGIIWMIILIVQLFKYNITDFMVTRLTMLSLFWHFLDIIWIFVFSIVYLTGML